MELVTADIGGTHARFALASVAPDGAITLGEPITLKTSDHVSLLTAWEEFGRRAGRPLPPRAAIAIAAPVNGETIRMTNNSWLIHTGSLDSQLGLDRFTLINDFGAVAHAAARAGDGDFIHLAGPDTPLPSEGTITVIGPGTGLGVAHFYRSSAGYHVQATEGGHVEFAPLDAIDDAIHRRLRARHRRVSVERVVSGPGIVEIHAVLAEHEGRDPSVLDDRTIWELGSTGEDALASAAVDRFCRLLGAVAGDFALGQGAVGVVVAGGLGYRIRERLRRSGFAEGFRFKGRYEMAMAAIPVRLITHPQPGLFGAASAFVQQHRFA